MPILGLTDNVAAFPRIGELRKGAEKPKTGNKPGADLTHFRFTSKDSAVSSKFHAVYGSEPAAINVFFPYATADENLEAWIEEWAAGGLKWRGDGKTLHIWQTKDGTYSQEPKPQPQNGGKQVGRLKVIIPELGRLAYVVALTTSTHDIMEVHANLKAFEALRGDLRGIPFILSRVPRMISTPSGKNGQRARREKWMWHIEASTEWVQAQLSVMQRQALPSGGGNRLAIAAKTIDHDTGEIIEPDNEEIEGEIVEAVNGNGNRQPDTKATFWGSLTDIEKNIYKLPEKFFVILSNEITRWENEHAARTAFGKLFDLLPIEKEFEQGKQRVEMYRSLCKYAEWRDAGQSSEAAADKALVRGGDKQAAPEQLPFDDVKQPALDGAFA